MISVPPAAPSFSLPPACSVGDAVRPGRYVVHTRFHRSILLFNAAERPLFVVNPSIGPGPLNWVTPDPAAAVPGDTLSLRFTFAALADKRYDSRLLPLPLPARKHLLHLLRTRLASSAPADSLISIFADGENDTISLPAAQRNRDRLFQSALPKLACGNATAARLIRGCGAGLTPSGDDFLCGWMLAMRLCHRRGIPALLAAAKGGNRVSNAFLSISAQGRVNVAVKRLLTHPTAANLASACAFGHTSGADLLCGLRSGLESFLLVR